MRLTLDVYADELSWCYALTLEEIFVVLSKLF